MNIGAAIHDARVKKKLTQADLAALVYTDQSNVCAYERNYIKNHNPDLLRRFGAVLGIELVPETVYEKFMREFLKTFSEHRQKRKHVLWGAGMDECCTVVEDTAARVLQRRFYR